MRPGRYWLKGLIVRRLKRLPASRCIASSVRRFNAFALYEVLLGVTIFVIGVLALGRSVENCMNASALSAEEDRVRQILANRMAEIQATPGIPDAAKSAKIDTGYGPLELVQKVVPANLEEAGKTELTGEQRVVLTANWSRGGVAQSRSVEFYVYRPG